MVLACEFFDKCGGCDLLDLNDNDYQQTKKDALHKILAGLQVGHIDYHFIGPKSRRRVNVHINTKNVLGFFAKKTRDIIAINQCYVACDVVSDFIVVLQKFIKSQEYGLFSGAMISAFDNGLDVVLSVKKDFNFLQMQKWTAFAKANDINLSYRIKSDVSPVYLARANQIFYDDFTLNLDSKTFLQATKAGLDHIILVIREFLTQNPQIRNIADIYAGYGAYSFAIADLVHVCAFEGSADMVKLINKNVVYHDLSHKIKSCHRDLFQDAIDKRELNDFDALIINPPRNGATPQIKEIAKSALKNVLYVSCNPKSFAFDAKILQEAGFVITKMVALDQFHGSNHMEVIAGFKRT